VKNCGCSTAGPLAHPGQTTQKKMKNGPGTKSEHAKKEKKKIQNGGGQTSDLGSRETTTRIETKKTNKAQRPKSRKEVEKYPRQEKGDSQSLKGPPHLVADNVGTKNIIKVPNDRARHRENKKQIHAKKKRWPWNHREKKEQHTRVAKSLGKQGPGGKCTVRALFKTYKKPFRRPYGKTTRL